MIAFRLRQLAQLRSRLLSQRATLTAIAVVLGGLLLMTALDVRFGLPWVARILGLLAIVALGVLAFRRSIAARSLAERDAARLVEAAHPDFGQSVRTAAQIAPRLTPDSPPIETALIDQTAKRLAPLPLEQEVAPRGTVLPAALAAAALTVCWLAALFVSSDWRTGAGRALGLPISFTRVHAAATPALLKGDETVRILATLSGRPADRARAFLRNAGEDWREVAMTPVNAGQFDLMLSGLATPLEFYVRSGDGRSAAGRVDVRLPPKLGEITARLEYPAYTGFPPVEEKGGDIEAIEGTKVRLEFAFDRPVAEARVAFSDGTTAAIAFAGAEGRAEFLVPARELKWHIAGRDTSGDEFETPSHQLKGIEDKLPTVKLAEPREDVEVTPLQELLARVQARDDLGLASVGLMLQIGTKAETLLEKKFEALDVRQAAEMATAYLETHGLTLNDSLLIHAYATDHKPRGGARAVSAMVAVDIREFQRRFRAAGAGDKECKCVDLVEKMIQPERRLFSDTTQLKELSASQEVPKALLLPLAIRQNKVIGTAAELQEYLDEWLDPELGEMKETLQEAKARMLGAVAKLTSAQLAEGAAEESAALASLLKLRQQLLYKVGQKKGGSRPTEQKTTTTKEERPSLTELAEKIEATAREEQSVAAQAQALAPEAKTPRALQRQHDAATGDLAEVLGELDAHPTATDAVRDRGNQTEKLLRAAGRTLAAQPATATAPLAQSEAALRELAEHLRALEQPLDDKALEKLAQRADKAAECLAGCAQCAKGDGKGEGKGKSGEGKGKGESGQGGETPAAFAEKVAALSEQAATLDDTLRRWSGEGEQAASANAGSLRGLRKAQGTERMAQELRTLGKDLAKTARPDPALAEEAAKLAARQEALAAALRKERDAMRETRAQQLTELRKRVQALVGDMATATVGKPGAAPEPAQATRAEISRRLPSAEGAKLFDDLKATGDADLQLTAESIYTNRQRPVLAWRALRNADARLAVLLTSLKRIPPVAVREGRVPEGYRRLMQNYFQALSDDFGDEGEPPAPAKK